MMPTNIKIVQVRKEYNFIFFNLIKIFVILFFKVAGFFFLLHFTRVHRLKACVKN